MNTPAARDSHEFICTTNADYAAWCSTFYIFESLDENGRRSLDGQWAWREQERRKRAALAALRARIAELEKPIDIILHCPACLKQHIDEPERSPSLDNTGILDWDNPPHCSHLCHDCGFIWRPADVATNGVAAVKTKGGDDMVLVKGPLEVMRWIRIRDAARPTPDWEGDRP